MTFISRQVYKLSITDPSGFDNQPMCTNLVLSALVIGVENAARARL